jgi:stearoyl-CoA desaturase (delta-9 desaturase)
MMEVQGGAASGAFKVNSLSNLDKADPVAGRVVWDGPRSLWNMGMLASALIAGPIFFTWQALLVFLLLAGATLCVGHSVGFHRRLIHRSFDCPKWLERAMIWVGTLVGMGGPIWTVHLHDIRDWGQRQPDCHWFLRHGKPILIDGFYYLNFRLVFDRPPTFDAGPGISDDRFYQFLQRSWMLHQLPLAALLFLAGGWPFVIWGVPVRVAVCTTMHWYISYRAHTDGPQDWLVDGAAIQGYNVPRLAIPTMGESWHSNHHAFPASACHGLYPGQIDLGYGYIKLLERIGLARNIQLPRSLPPRAGITPLSDRALAVAATGQATTRQ